MAASQLFRCVAFGPYEVNPATGELTKSGVRIRLTGQPLNILLLLLARRGQVVTSDELRRKLWGDGTFVDFEHGLHAAINKLRRALSDSAEKALYIETVPGSGYRFIAPITETPRAVPESVAAPPEEQTRPHSKFGWWLAFAAAACLASFALGWLIRRSPSERRPWQLSQLTTDSGLSYSPAISRDGTLVAYSSDRNGPGQLDLYVKQVSGANSLRLTFDGLGNTTPDFSPDGTKIVFHSNRDGGGIYQIPTLGGQPRLLVKEGQNPKFSPDGSKIAYWIGGENVASAVPGSGTVWVVPVESGRPWRVGTDFTGARYPIWSPDGKGLLLVGYTSSHAFEGNSMDWWFVSANGKLSAKTGVYTPFIRAGLQISETVSANPSSVNWPRDMPHADCWSSSGRVIFSALSGYTHNLWQTHISPETGKANGDLNRLTVGAANEWDASCGGEDRIAFTGMQARSNIWSAVFALNGGKSKGPLEQVTKSPGREDYVDLSRDGRYVAFASPQAGSNNIWLQEVATGKELRVAESPLMQAFPVISPSGGKVAFSVYSADGTRLIYVANLGGPPEQVCRGCLRATDWSSDEKSLLVFGGNPYQVSALDIASRKQTLLLKHEKYNLLYARYSPDNRWVSFTARLQPNHSKIMVAPIGEERPIPESQWIQIGEGGLEDWANWSPDGRTMYFTSARDGYFCLWGQRIDPASRRPIGEPFAALHLHGNANYQQGGWSAAGDRIAMVLRADSGNIWLLSRPASR